VSGPPQTRMRVLMVDDEPPILRSLTRLLAFEDYELATAGNATEAMAQLAQGETAVILSDFDLGDMGGVELLRQAREKSPDTSRILFSGHIDIELLRHAVNGGEVYRFVTKPWSDDELLQAVRQGIERWQLLHRNRMLAQRAEEQNQQLKRFNAELEQMVGERTAALELRNRALSLSQEVLDGLPVAVVGIDPDGQVALTNDLARRLFPELLPGERPGSSGAPVWEWSRDALVNGNQLVVDGSLGPMRVEVMALGERGVVMTVIPLAPARTGPS
jgi:response regulator RpfG family c-di-GMP phosphodiesterase